MSSRRETEYRGYKIEMERRDLCWTVSVSPTRPELPILSRSSFSPKERPWLKHNGALIVPYAIDQIF